MNVHMTIVCLEMNLGPSKNVLPAIYNFLTEQRSIYNFTNAILISTTGLFEFDLIKEKSN